MMRLITTLLTITTITTTPLPLNQLHQGCQSQLTEWATLPTPADLLNSCALQHHLSIAHQLHTLLANQGHTLTPQHLASATGFLKKHPQLGSSFRCIFQAVKPQDNLFFEEARPLKRIKQFLRAHPSTGRDLLSPQTNLTLAGQRWGRFLRGLFEFYQLEVVDFSGTLAGEFLRALTVRSDVFEREDLALCLSLESSARLSTHLEHIDINNVFVKVPEVHKALQFASLSPKCSDGRRAGLLGRLKEALREVDMFRVMLADSQPFVTIATEKYAGSQLRLLARVYADIVANRQHYVEISRQQQHQL